ncbi:hypothetical protein NUW54_g8710 [Trametes sanguinea]|uniref:Uncharacterized protein n=1 Tax=Trametes sanguinea TaxID=158606 RepID=A0ACC1PEH0_9APHY|nr:hypothetical protein NUW54_g8710 [Trametes sanguinea]
MSRSAADSPDPVTCARWNAAPKSTSRSENQDDQVFDSSKVFKKIVDSVDLSALGQTYRVAGPFTPSGVPDEPVQRLFRSLPFMQASIVFDFSAGDRPLHNYHQQLDNGLDDGFDSIERSLAARDALPAPTTNGMQPEALCPNPSLICGVSGCSLAFSRALVLSCSRALVFPLVPLAVLSVPFSSMFSRAPRSLHCCSVVPCSINTTGST